MANDEDLEAGAETDRDLQSKFGEVESDDKSLPNSFVGSGSHILVLSPAAFIVEADDSDDEVGDVAARVIRELPA